MKKYGIAIVLTLILLSTAVYLLNIINFDNTQKASDGDNPSQSNVDVVNESSFGFGKNPHSIKYMNHTLQHDKTQNDKGHQSVKHDESVRSHDEAKSKGLYEASEEQRNILMNSGGITPNLVSFVCGEFHINFHFASGLISSIDNLISPEVLRHSTFKGYKNCTLKEGSYVNISSPIARDGNGNYINLFRPTVDIRGADGVTCYNYTGYTISQQTPIKCGDNIYEKLPGFNESFVVEKHVPYEQYNKIDAKDMGTPEPADESDMVILNNASS